MSERHSIAIPLFFSMLALCIFLRCGGDKGTSPKPEPAPQIVEEPAVSNLSASTATISWVTDVEATTVLQYGYLSGQYLFRDSSATERISHVVKLVGLRSNSNYYCIARSTNGGGVAATSEFVFRTKLGALDLAPAGWAEYQTGTYQAAIGLFKELLILQPQSFEACNGLGWSYAAAPVDSLQLAFDYFNTAISLKANLTDALAGRGFVQLALKIYAFAIMDFVKVLELSPNYVFAHNVKVDVRDIRVGLAECYFSNQDFAQAQAQVNLLAPGNGLDANHAASWVVEGRLYATYAEALLAWIEKLKA